MGFAFHPNCSDHNGIADAVERSTGDVRMAGGSPREDADGGPLPLPECELWREGCSVSTDDRVTAD